MAANSTLRPAGRAPRRGASRAPSQKPFYVTKVAQIRAIASAIRQDIVDATAVIGPCAISSLAAFLGRRPDSLYYHVSALQRVGLLTVAGETTTDRGRRVPLYDVPGRPVLLRYDPGNPRNRDAVARFATTTLRSANRAFARALSQGGVTVEGELRDLWTARWKGWLTREDLAEVNALLARLIGLLRRGAGHADPEATLCELTFVLAPVRPRSATRPAASDAPRRRHAPRRAR